MSIPSWLNKEPTPIETRNRRHTFKLKHFIALEARSGDYTTYKLEFENMDTGEPFLIRAGKNILFKLITDILK